MLLPPSLHCRRACPLLAGCVRTLYSGRPRALRPLTELLLRRRPPSRLDARFRSRKSQEEEWRNRNRTVLTYIAAAGVGMIGLSYASVPLYRLYCQVRLSSSVFARTRPDSDFSARLTGNRTRRHGGGRPQCRPGGDDEAGEGEGHKGHLQRRHPRQHPVELQASADRDLCMPLLSVAPPVSPTVAELSCSCR